MDGKGNDLDLINDGFIVPDDYIDSEELSQISLRVGETEAEYNLRLQQK